MQFTRSIILILCKIMTKSTIFRISALLFLVFINTTISAQTAGSAVDGYTTYKIQPKDTWTRLAGIYGISIADLQKANPGVTTLKIGATISVPAIKKAVGNSAASTAIKNTLHTVQKGETLYRISKMYNQTIADIKKWNNLTSDNVSLGSTLIVGKSRTTIEQKQPVLPEEKTEVVTATSPQPQPDDKILKEENIATEPEIIKGEVIKPINDTAGNIPSVDSTVKKITETGVATWLSDDEMNQNKFYALHRSAPIGTIIKVINRMNNNAVFVKVVGVLPDTGDNENTIIKITKAAAQRIGALDQRFTAELSYGVAQ